MSLTALTERFKQLPPPKKGRTFSVVGDGSHVVDPSSTSAQIVAYNEQNDQYSQTAPTLAEESMGSAAGITANVMQRVVGKGGVKLLHTSGNNEVRFTEEQAEYKLNQDRKQR